MYYKLERENVYASCTFKMDDTWEELDDDLLEMGYDGGYRYKTYLATEEYLTEKRINQEIPDEMRELKHYLTETDYVVAKLSELQIEDEEEYRVQLKAYQSVLNKRKESRARVRELEEELATLRGA